MSEPDNMVERVAKAIEENATVGYRISLVSLVDGVSTYTMEVDDGSPMREFNSHEEAYEYVRSRRNLASARAAIDAMRQLPEWLLGVGHDVIAETYVHAADCPSFQDAYEAVIDAALATPSPNHPHGEST